MNRNPLVGFGLAVLLGVLAGCATHPPSPPAAAGAAGGAGASAPAGASLNAAGFARWVAGFRSLAKARGVAPAVLAEAFDNAEFRPRVIALDHHQPEFNQPIWSYLDTAVSATRVAAGRAKLAAHRAVAARVAARYGVPAPVLVAIWGMESDYGANMGHFETINALATLGYQGRREKFVDRQLYAALKILGDNDISPAELRGSWAGAMGNPQFMPTSFLRYAVDADGDGKPDIWHSVPDTLASIAHYLAANGWQAGQPWGCEVILPKGFNYALTDGQTHRSTAAWRAAGVQAVSGRQLPAFAAAAIIVPAGARGPAFMVGPNFRAIRHYNNATSYALAVGLLADQIRGEPGVQQPWPRNEQTLSRPQVRSLQQKLDALGYASGQPDGVLGPRTRSALRAFQRAHGLTADGFPTRSLLSRVQAAAGQG